MDVSTSAMKIYNGKCNCKNFTIIFKTNKEPSDLIPLKCNCSFCLKKEVLYLSDPNGEVIIHIKEERFVSKEMFALETSEFITCSKCNMFIGAVTPSSTFEVFNFSFMIWNISP